MKMLLLILSSFLLCGCATQENGKRVFGWVIAEKGGCVEKVTIRKKGLRWQKCFK